MLKIAEDVAAKFISDARSDVAVKLQAVNDACKSIYDNGGTINIPSVRGWLVTNRGITIGASTLMNRRKNPRTGETARAPARLIIDEYIKAQKLSPRRVAKHQSMNSFLGSDLFSESEMKEIHDHQIRYKIQLLVGRARNLETQLTHARIIHSLPILSVSEVSQRSIQRKSGVSLFTENNHDLTLDEEELEALRDFLDESAKIRRKVQFDVNGSLRVTRSPSPKTSTIAISKPFLESALQKIIQLYRRGS
jgi:hypothetical protein